MPKPTLKYLYFILALNFLFLGFVSRAQKNNYKITGTVVSDSSRRQVTNATVSLLFSRDSTVAEMRTTDNKGKFSLDGLKAGAYQLVISEINHETLLRQMEVGESKKEIHLDTLVLKVKSNNMEMITIMSQQPVVIKPDTVEFNAGSFKVKPNDMVEELLKKLPGVEVAKDGSLSANGEKVTKVLVDGKPFFGNDPRTATQNLPADIIDKVQVIDEKSEQTKATKIEDGQVEKVINLTIKKNKKVGSFGRAYLGYGTDDRYEARVNANHFNNNRKMAMITGTNNTGRTDNTAGQNEENAVYNNYSGVTKDLQSKITYTDKWSKKLDVSANLNYTNNSNTSEQVRNRQTLFTDTTNFYFEQNKNNRKRWGAGGGIYFEYRPDTMLKITVNESINFYKTDNRSSSSFNSSISETRKLNEGTRENRSFSKTPSVNGSINISRRLKKKGRAVFFNLNNSENTSLNDGLNNSSNYFYPLSAPDYDRILNQFSNYDTRNASLNASASYSEPLNKKSSVNLSVNYSNSRNNTLRETFDFNPFTSLYDLLNDSLSNNFDNTNKSGSLGLSYNYFLKKSRISLGASWQESKTESRSLTKDSVFGQSKKGLIPFASFNLYDKGKNISITYNYGTRAPQAYQLQNVVDNSNPLFIRYGNPALKYSITHRVNYNLNLYKQKTGLNINSNGNFNAVLNNIGSSTTYDKATGIQTSRPVNLDGVYNWYARVYVNKNFKASGNRNSFYGSASLNSNRNINLVNGEKNKSTSFSRRFNTGINLDLKEFAALSLGYTFTIQTATYSLRKEQNNRTTSNGIEASLRVTPNKTTDFSIYWNFNQNKGSLSGFNRETNMVNADVTQYLNKRKSFWLKLKVYDLLKQNISVYRYSNDNFIEDFQTNVLTRFILLSINFKFNKFGSGK
jgi:hypothetical protein